MSDVDCDLCGLPTSDGAPRCAECARYHDYLASLTPAQRRAEEEAVATHVALSEVTS